MEGDDESYDQVKIQKTISSLEREGIVDELLAHLNYSREISGYARQETFAARLNEFHKESKELQEAFESKDWDHVSEEIGDVLWDLLFLFVLLKEKNIPLKKVIKDRIAKQVRRLPHVYEGKIVSLEEEFAIFKKRKKLEREGKLKVFGFED